MGESSFGKFNTGNWIFSDVATVIIIKQRKITTTSVHTYLLFTTLGWMRMVTFMTAQGDHFIYNMNNIKPTLLHTRSHDGVVDAGTSLQRNFPTSMHLVVLYCCYEVCETTQLAFPVLNAFLCPSYRLLTCQLTSFHPNLCWSTCTHIHTKIKSQQKVSWLHIVAWRTWS